MKTKHAAAYGPQGKRFLLFLGYILCGIGGWWGDGLTAEATGTPLSLKQTVEQALEVNLNLRIARSEIEAAEYNRRVARSYFLPTGNLAYQYQRNDDEFVLQGLGTLTPEEKYTFAASLTQPLFTGFSILNRYEAAKIGLDAARTSEILARQDIILAAKKVYFTLLRSQKFLEVAKEAVSLGENQETVARQFYEVGMTPLNDLLKAQVELANARQEFIRAANGVDVAKANFNTLLRRPVTQGVAIEDISDYEPVPLGLEDYLNTADGSRIEIQRADFEVALTQKDVEIAKKDYYPAVNLSWTYYQEGTDWDAQGGAGLYSDASGWNVKAMASWDLWQWGRTHYGIRERIIRLQQAKHRKEALLDQIRLEVTDAYLQAIESEKAIVTAKAAITQAEENFRITQERYGAQMATSLEVFDAQTLLSRARTNYYGALYFYKIARASLDRAMGRETLE